VRLGERGRRDRFGLDGEKVFSPGNVVTRKTRRSWLPVELEKHGIELRALFTFEDLRNASFE
jgi:hypothetical protein